MVENFKSLVLAVMLLLLFTFSNAQNYEKDWANLYQKAEKGESISTKEIESFIKKHQQVFEKYPDNSTQLYSLLANNYSNAGDGEAAGRNYLESYRYAQTAQDTSLKHIVELSLAILNYNQNNLLESEKYFVKCMAGMAAVYGQSSREYTQTFYDYTRLLIDLEKYEQASPYVDALLYYYKTLDGELNTKYQSLLTCKAIISQNTGRYEEAIQVYKTMLENNVMLQLKDTLGHVIIVSNLGDVYRESGNYNEGVMNLKLAKKLHRQYGVRDQEIIATIENNLALCYKGLSDYKLAEEAYNNSLQIYKLLGANSEPYCSTLSNKADLLRMLGRNGEASELLLQALAIRKERFGTRTENYANALSNLGNVYYDAGFKEEALQKHLEAEEIYRNVVGEGHQGYGNCLNSLSLCYLDKKDYKNAESYKLRALEIIEHSVGKDHYRYASFLLSTYGLYRQTKNLDKAEKNIREALALISKNFGKNHELYAHGLLAMAEIHTLRQKFEEAGPFYFEALDYYSGIINDYFNAMSEENQSSFLATISGAFESYNIYLINYKLNFPGKDLPEHLKRALRYQLQLKSMLASRSAQLNREVQNSGNESIKRLYAEWMGLKNQLINDLKSVEAANMDHNAMFERTSELERQLKASLKNFSKSGVITFEDLKLQLKPKEAAIEIFKTVEQVNDTVGRCRYGALVVKAGSMAPEFILFKEGDLLNDYIFPEYYRKIDEMQKDSFSYTAFFKPFEKSLKDVERIYVSPDGIFNKVSIVSLFDPGRGGYLADRLEVFQTSNLGSLSQKKDAAPLKSKNAILFGYPDYEYDFNSGKKDIQPDAPQLVAKRYGLTGLSKLPGTKTEVEEISRELNTKGWTSTVFTEENASESNIRKLSSPTILHIATHGYYLKDVESEDKLFLGFERSSIKNNSLLRSGLILAGAGPSTTDSTNRQSENDGILTAYEASLLNLNGTELVVLSACQTGLGDEMGTEGVAGLQRSLTIAGAKNIMMSLWPVDDEATQMLMTGFYKNYASGQTIENAFKLAQTELRKTYTHPVYWAAFVLLKTFN